MKKIIQQNLVGIIEVPQAVPGKFIGIEEQTKKDKRNNLKLAVAGGATIGALAVGTQKLSNTNKAKALYTKAANLVSKLRPEGGRVDRAINYVKAQKTAFLQKETVQNIKKKASSVKEWLKIDKPMIKKAAKIGGVLLVANAIYNAGRIEGNAEGLRHSNSIADAAIENMENHVQNVKEFITRLVK